MRVVVIGGSGHIGTYLTPRLVEAGHRVINVSRQRREPYRAHRAWSDVENVTIDREAEEASQTFGPRIRAINADAVIDLICYQPASARHLAEALRGHTGVLAHCGTIWIHGPSVEVPTTEEQPRRPFGDYGIRKAEIETYLLGEAGNGLPVTLLHPGHLVGPGWNPITPAGNFNQEIFHGLATRAEVTLPNLGMETLHHVHADDVAQAFVLAVEKPSQSIGQSFHVVSRAAVTLRGYAETVAAWFGKPPSLRFEPFAKWRELQPERDAQITWDHIARSPNCSIEKARRLLGYAPRYSSFEAIRESLAAMPEFAAALNRG
jgi:nucleoside-diphosphate-sugar epimerase